MQIAGGTGGQETPHWTDARRGYRRERGRGLLVFFAVPRDLFLLTAHTGDFYFLFLYYFIFYLRTHT